MQYSDDLQELPSLKNTPQTCHHCLTVNPHLGCPCYLTCQHQKKQKANIVIHDYEDKKEVLIFKDAFWQREQTFFSTNFDRTRKFFYDENGVLCPKNIDSVDTILQLLTRLEDSRKRSLQNFYSYVVANDWDYFVTITVKSSEMFNKYDDDDVMYIWKLFRQKMQYKFNDITIIAVPEYHKKGGLHIHCLIGSCNIDKFLSIAINSKVYIKRKGVLVPNPNYLKPLTTKYGDSIYNLAPSVYDFGHTEVVKIKDKNFLKICNYMSKYMIKDNAKVKYNKKLFFRTQNLKFSNTLTAFQTEEEKTNFLNELNLLNVLSYKETDKLISVWVKKEEES